MKTTVTLPLSLLTAAALLVSSCTPENKPQDTIVNYSLNGCYAVVTPVAQAETQAESEISTDVAISIDGNWTTNRSSVSLSGIRIGATVSPLLKLSNLESYFSAYLDTWNAVKGEAAETATLATGGTATVEHFAIEWLDRTDLVPTLAASYSPAVRFSYMTDGYIIAGGRAPFIMGGSTTTSSAMGQPYTNEGSLYVIVPDFATMTARVFINKAVFAQNMPAQDMELPGIPFKVNPDASLELAADAVTPLAAGVPQESVPVTDFKAVVYPGNETSTVEFKCNYRGKMEFGVKAEITHSGYGKYLSSMQ